MPAICVKSPGKTILFGEHAVVYGYPAIAVPLNSIYLQICLRGLPDQAQGTIQVRNIEQKQDMLLSSLPESNPIQTALHLLAQYLTLSHLPATEITISSTIPVASGLGSSAALAVALIRGFSQYLGFKLSNRQINELAFEIEKIQHGTPSGIDNSVIAFNQPIYYIKDQPIEYLKLIKPITIIVADTGVRSLTKEVVAEVKNRLDEKPDVITSLLNQIGNIAQTAKEKLITGDLAEIGCLMNKNQVILQQLGVSCPELDNLIDIALKEGAFGAKLCGSGKGGNMVAVANSDQTIKIKNALLSHGAASVLIANIGQS